MSGKNRAAPTAAQQRLSAQRAAAARQRIEAAHRKRRLLVVAASIGTVIVLVAALVIVKVVTSGSSSSHTTAKASGSITAQVTSVPASVLDTIGAGTGAGPRKTLTGAALTANGLPRVLYVGAEWCPYCAAERWALAVALSRFGTLTGLGVTRSRSNDVDPNTATLSFHGSHYASKYVVFTADEIQNNAGKTLDHISSADNTLFETIGGGGFPFIDIAGKYYFSVQYDPSLLGGSGTTQKQIAAAIHDPSSAIAKAVDGSANILTAAICTTTADAPSSVCKSPGVVAAAKSLTSS